MRSFASSWVGLGAWATLALALGRTAVLAGMEFLVHDSHPALSRMRIVSELPGIVFWSCVFGWCAAWLAWAVGGLRGSGHRLFRLALVLAVGALFQVFLAGWFGLDASRVVALQTTLGKLANGVLGLGALLLALLLVVAGAGIRRGGPAGAAGGRVWIPGAAIAIAFLFLRFSQVGRPDVILIVVDTLRGDYVHGSDRDVQTPNLDALAAEGIVFGQAMSHAASTLPSHTALFSSRYPHRTGVLNNGQKVSPHLPLLAEWLQAAGFETRAVLSLGTLWSLPSQDRIERGFGRYDDEKHWNIRQAPLTIERLGTQLSDLEEARPFFLFAHFSDPHEPYNAHGTVPSRARLILDGEPLAEVGTADMTLWAEEVTLAPGEHRLEVRSEDPFLIKTFFADDGAIEWRFDGEGETMVELAEADLVLVNGSAGTVTSELTMWIQDVPTNPESVERYGLEVEFVDRHVGELIDQLKALDLWDDALVIFTSDHGEALGEHGSFGHASSLYEEQIHVPLIIKPPRDHSAWDALRSRSESVARHVDLVPTILAFLGLPDLPGQQGASLTEPGGRIGVAEIHPPEAPRELYAMRDDEYKLIYHPEEDAFELYHLPSDPNELLNLRDDRPDIRADWAETLRRTAEFARRLEPESDSDVEDQLRQLGYAGD